VSISAFNILGLIAGAIAKALWKGHEPGGFRGTLLVGVVGALLGVVIASAAGLGGLSSFFSLGTWRIAIGGALFFLLLFSLMMQRRGGGAARVAHSRTEAVAGTGAGMIGQRDGSAGRAPPAERPGWGLRPAAA
jgi:uncharacterized membrane protein YeaQ/YmgE (transglycosylase-associated protein family)